MRNLKNKQWTCIEWEMKKKIQRKSVCITPGKAEIENLRAKRDANAWKEWERKSNNFIYFPGSQIYLYMRLHTTTSKPISFYTHGAFAASSC